MQGMQGNMSGYQGTPPWLGGGQNVQGFGGNYAPMGGGPQGVGPKMFQPQGGGPQGMSDAMMHPFAPRNLGPQGVGPNFGAGGGVKGPMAGGPAQMQGALEQFYGADQDNVQNQIAQMQGAMGGPQAVGGGMMLPGGGPAGQMKNYVGDMGGAMGGGMRPQRRFPGALSRGIMQGMAPPPQMAQPVPPAPYGGQQFRMW
jgi:hypothetical protein